MLKNAHLRHFFILRKGEMRPHFRIESTPTTSMYFYPPLAKGDKGGFKNYAEKISPCPSFPKRGIRGHLYYLNAQLRDYDGLHFKVADIAQICYSFCQVGYGGGPK